MIAEQENYLDKTISFLISDIIEYDMKSAGFNIIKSKKLLPDEVIAELETLPKHERHEKIGKLHYKYKGLGSGLKEGFREFRVLFYENNDLQDDDILSIKKDAIFTKKYCYNLKYKNVTFEEKNVYQAYVYLEKLRIELYWNSLTGDIDVKGINDEVVELHDEYMLKFISTYIRLLSSYDIDGARKYIMKYINDYKQRKLPAGYYREFNPDSQFKAIIAGKVVPMDRFNRVDMCDISFNYLNVLIPLLNLIL